MKKIAKSFLFMITSLAVAGMAHGQDNTAYGEGALNSNNSGVDNSAFGFEMLYYNYSGYYNTAVGYQAMFESVVGNANTAVGYGAMYGSLPEGGPGNNNTATGYQTLYAIYDTDNNNTASGYQALYGNFNEGTGNNNTAAGYEALYNNYGSNNTALGYEAGVNVTSGSNNIEIGNAGAPGDARVIKIGTEGTQKRALIAGIYSNTAVNGLAVVIGSNGELGAVSSSKRFKTAIAPMGSNTEKLHRLRPVIFHYKADPRGTLRYGLIAEEVAKVYPELVVRDSKGRADGVRYDELAPMLLNEVQKQAAVIGDLKRDELQKLAVQDEEIQQLKRQLTEIRAALVTQPNRDPMTAQR